MPEIAPGDSLRQQAAPDAPGRLRPGHRAPAARLEAVEERRDQRVVAAGDALAQPRRRAVADGEAVDVFRIAADEVAAERVGGVQVAETEFARDPHVVLVEIAV